MHDDDNFYGEAANDVYNDELDDAGGHADPLDAKGDSTEDKVQKGHHKKRHHHHRTGTKKKPQPPDPTDTSSLMAFERFRHKAVAVSSQHQKTVKDTVTLVTQTDLTRIARLREICKRWKGPLVATVFLPEPTRVLEETLKASLAKLCQDVTLVSYTYPDHQVPRPMIFETVDI